MKKLLILSLTLIFAAELEVDGNLKVTGNIDAQNNPIKNVGPPTTLTDAVNGNALQDALRDDGVYEFKFIVGMLVNGSNTSNSNIERYSKYFIVDDFEGSFNYFQIGLASILNEHSSNGWIIKTLGINSENNNTMITYELRRKLEDSE